MLRRVPVVVAALAVACILVACAAQPTGSNRAAPVRETTSGASSPTSASTSSELTQSAVHPTAKALAYANGIGGVSHEGQTLCFIIGASVSTEAEAQALLDAATPKFGDMQSYFIVQRSDNFTGMRPGWWVVIEAYRATPSTENLDFGKRGFPHAYVKRAIVRTTDPIPVYEDLVGK